jgi:hypothetical protein
MDMELLAKKMRDRAIALEITDTSPRAVRKSAKLPKPVYMSVEERIEELKKLYFNAGRWAGGSKDYVARQAHLALEKLDNADR